MAKVTRMRRLIIQIATKTQRACDTLIKCNERLISSEERSIILNDRKLTKRERIEYYQEKKAILNIERRGKFFKEIKEEIIEQEKPNVKLERSRFPDSLSKRLERTKTFRNIQFPNTIHQRKDIEHDLF